MGAKLVVLLEMTIPTNEGSEILDQNGQVVELSQAAGEFAQKYGWEYSGFDVVDSFDDEQ